ncbi:MAG TPA: peptidoglycan-binding domain-containing protein [Candidatus Limnocylindria bacterium]|nr:peptidoglycan-binding domain-containing protein [Candidatus Limnocylindria bacterium]
MQTRQPMNRAQRTILLLALAVIILAGALFFLFTPRGDEAPRATPSPEPTFASVIDALQTLPTPTPSPTPVPTPTPEPTPTPPPTPIPMPQEVTTLRKGSKGPEVVNLQARLIQLGYLAPGSNDGDFGSGTEAAVKAFQQNNGLEPDGLAGRATQTLLFSEDAVPAR